jgi:hypothetical protein
MFACVCTQFTERLSYNAQKGMAAVSCVVFIGVKYFTLRLKVQVALLYP